MYRLFSISFIFNLFRICNLFTKCVCSKKFLGSFDIMFGRVDGTSKDDFLEHTRAERKQREQRVYLEICAVKIQVILMLVNVN